MHELLVKNFFIGREPLSSRFFWCACVTICIIGLFLRLHTLDRSLWLDETYSSWFAAVPLHELWHSVPLYETHPPMYYTLLKGWTAVFGNSEVGMRGMSVLASLATVLLLAFSGKMLHAGPTGDRVALLAALFLAVNKGNIDYSQQARPYALETLTASLAILFSLMLLRAISQHGGRERSSRSLFPGVLGLGVSAGATLWLHNTAILICFGIWTGLVIALMFMVPGKRLGQAAAVAVPGVIALLIWSPFIPMFIKQNTGLSGLAFWIVTNWKDFLFALGLVAGGKLPLVPVSLLVMVGFAKLWRLDRASALHVAIALLLPLFIVLLYSYLRTPIFIDRLFEWAAPSVMALAAVGVIVGLRQEALRPWAALLVVSLCLTATYLYYKVPTENWRAVIGYIAANAKPGDIVIASPSEVDAPLRYYAGRNANFPDILHMPAPFPAVGMAGRTYVSNLGAPAIVDADREVVHAALQTHRRVWLIEVRPDLYDPHAVVRTEILSSRSLIATPIQGPASMSLFE
jgi:hypothetical protein